MTNPSSTHLVNNGNLGLIILHISNLKSSLILHCLLGQTLTLIQAELSAANNSTDINLQALLGLVSPREAPVCPALPGDSPGSCQEIMVGQNMTRLQLSNLTKAVAGENIIVTHCPSIPFCI